MEILTWSGVETVSRFVDKITDSFEVQVATAGAGLCYFYTPDDQRNIQRGKTGYPSIFGFDIRITFKNPTYIHSVEHFSLNSNESSWVKLENRPRLDQFSYSSAFPGFFEGTARGLPERQNIPKDRPYNSILIDTCYVGYFSDPFHPVRSINNYDHKDCYSIIQTSNGTFFFYLLLPELNCNVADVSGKIIGEPLHFLHFDADAIQHVNSEANRLYRQIGVDPLIKQRMQIKKKNLYW